METLREIIANHDLKTLFQKYRQVVFYVIFGCVSTLVNIIAFWIINSLFGVNYKLANVLSWVIAVFCAYITNKIWVFESRGKTGKENVFEASKFFFFRLITLGVDMLCMYTFIEKLGILEIVSKIITNAIVVVANYLFSKLIIFRKKKIEQE